MSCHPRRGVQLRAGNPALLASLVRAGQEAAAWELAIQDVASRQQEARQLAAYGAANSLQYSQFYQQRLELLNQQKPTEVME